MIVWDECDCERNMIRRIRGDYRMRSGPFKVDPLFILNGKRLTVVS